MNCSANEFTVAASFSAAAGTPPYCIAGGQLTLDAAISLSESKVDRYDVGFFVGQQGNSPDTTTVDNICSVASFPTITDDTCDVAPNPNQFSWFDHPFEGDTCGDYRKGCIDTPLVKNIKVLCQSLTPATDSNLSVPYNLSWKVGTTNDCTNGGGWPNGVYTDIPAKCQSGTASLSPTVIVGGIVEITKQTLPDGAGDTFTFNASTTASTIVGAKVGTSYSGGTGNSVSVNLTDGNSSEIYMGVVSSATRPLVITENAVADWDTSIACTDSGGGPVSYVTVNTASRTVTADLSTTNNYAKCTFTNTKRATVSVTKSLAPTSDTGTFNLLVGATTVASAAGNGGSGNTKVPGGAAVTVSETGAGGTNLANYDTTYSCSDGTGTVASGTGSSFSLTPAPGASVSCTFTNTRKATVTVSKSLAPTADGGTFNLLVGATTVATAVGHGGSGSTQVAGGSAVTISETGAGSTVLSDFVTTYNCSDGSTGTGTSFSLTPAAGANISCTFTNSRKLPLLTIVKSASAGSANPGEVLSYTIQVTNTGLGSAVNVVMRDRLSPFTAFGLTAYPSTGTPFDFTDSTPASGLTFGTPEYSKDFGSTWGYTPSSGGGGAPVNFDGDVTNWRIPMSGTLRSGGSFTLYYRAIVE